MEPAARAGAPVVVAARAWPERPAVARALELAWRRAARGHLWRARPAQPAATQVVPAEDLRVLLAARREEPLVLRARPAAEQVLDR
jgi:hypothetical protein